MPGGRADRSAAPVVAAAALGRIDVDAVERASGWRIVRQWDELAGCARFLAHPSAPRSLWSTAGETAVVGDGVETGVGFGPGADGDVATPPGDGEPAAPLVPSPRLGLLVTGLCDGWLESAADLLLELDAPASPGVADAGVVDDRELSLLAREGVEHRRFLLVHASAPVVTLATLVGGAARMRAGEAVTVLVPIAQTIAATHRLGRSIGGIALASTALDDTGRPLLLDWSRIGALPGRAPGRVPDAVREDWLAFARVADAVLSVVDSGEAARLAERIGASAERVRDEAAIAEGIVDALFSFAEPEAVGDDVLRGRGARARPFRGIAGRPAVAAGESHRRSWRSSPGSSTPWRSSRGSRSPASFGRTLLGAAAVACLASSTILVAGRLGAADGSNGASTNLPATASPADTSGSAVQPSSGIGGTAGADPAAAADATAGGRTGGAPSGAAAVPSASGVVDRAEAEERVRSAAGPGARVEDAAPALLALRAACLRERDAACLAGVYQAGAPGLARDGEVVEAGSERELSSAAVPVPPGASVRVRDEYGGLVAVELMDAGAALPTSLTLVRVDAGWRLRDVVLPA